MSGLKASWGLAIGNPSPSLCGSWEAVGPPWPLICLKKIHFNLFTWLSASLSFLLTAGWISHLSPLLWGALHADKYTRWLVSTRRIPSNRKSEMTKFIFFCNLILDVMSNHFCYILFIKSQSLNLAHIKRRGYIKVEVPRGRDNLESF